MVESVEETNQLLKTKFNLHKSLEVESAANRFVQSTGEKIDQDPLIRIQNYLDRLDHIINPIQLEKHPKFNRQERNLFLLKSRLYERFIIKPEDIPVSYWEHQKRIIRDRGQAGDLELVVWEKQKQQITEAVIADQVSSLDKWIDYFVSSDSAWIPNSLKYYAIRSVLNMAEYDKERKVYPQRSSGTTRPFPDLNREALSYVLDAINKKYQGGKFDLSALPVEEREQFEKLLQGENFSKLYAWAIEKITPATPEQLAATKGEWKKYPQGSNHMPLVKSLQGHGTGWCTAGESTAKAQLQGGDFYVFYSFDKDGKATVPRAAIRIQDGKIAEVRGIAADQNLDKGVVSIVEDKLKEFPDGDLYKKRVHDMELLTSIEHKLQLSQVLSQQELAFLYEVDSKIDGFGFSRDPRIAELRAVRNIEEDMPIVFSCTNEQIARRPNEINENTVAYVGKPEPGFFQMLPATIKYIYFSFPDVRFRREDIRKVTIGGKSVKDLQADLKSKNIQISDDARGMIRSKKFQSFDKPEEILIVKIKSKDLGLESQGVGIRVSQIYERAQTYGLSLCPPETGPYMRLEDYNQSLDSYYLIAMEPIRPFFLIEPMVFRLYRKDDGQRKLEAYPCHLGNKTNIVWSPDTDILFCIKK